MLLSLFILLLIIFYLLLSVGILWLAVSAQLETEFNWKLLPFAPIICVGVGAGMVYDTARRKFDDI